MASTIKTRILIISDTHCAQLSKDEDAPSTYPTPPFKSPLPSADLLIHCGDLTHNGLMEQYHRTLDMMKEIDAPVKVAIAGNHDLTLDRDYILNHVGKMGAQGAWNLAGSKDEAERIVQKATDLWLSPEGRARQEGVRLLGEGIHGIDLPNGAHVKVYANPYTPEFCDWAFAYEHNEDRFNPPETTLQNASNIAAEAMPTFDEQQPIDVCITHGPPYKRLDEVIGSHEPVGCPHLLRAVMRARPLVHCFGHIHEGWGGERVTWSQDVSDVSIRSCSLENWKNGEWKAGVAQDGEGIEPVDVDMDEARARHGTFLDLSHDGERGLARGSETLFLNAAVMTVRYKPLNPTWVLDLDLPARS
ncbi:uncharacterized protein LTR77_000345 [Saxophila tyrrhenica]|uniref:Calcineurin-like phosphoesterase domain-containing protein n=1 Tax=Saxophila tyrrhenica TaxID=1690608 RepID=A0AAV9PS95_9PEZI|nr:hypothetical protein LTR77_000345 [Saxophila tyrrhenica]